MQVNFLILATISLGSFLLFSVQPFLGKLLLPIFGGVSSTWITCLLFFQSVLFAGYLYSTLITGFLTQKKQKLLHASLLAVSLLQLPVSLKLIDSASPIISIILTLTFTILLPYFILSTNVSTLQSWIGNSSDDDKSKAWIYGLSNLFSFTALLSYPFLVEPVLGVVNQAFIWSMIYALYVCSAIAVIFLTFRKSSTQDKVVEHNFLAHINWNWLALSFFGNALLITGTSKLTQNIAAIPFLWILPLALYLLTFVLAFSFPRLNSRRLWLLGLLISGMLLVKFTLIDHETDLALLISTNLFLIFSGCMLVHGELYSLKPANKLLPQYYFIISFGGLVASLLAGILPCLIFSDLIELELILFMLAAYFLEQKLAEDQLLPKSKLLVNAGRVFLAAIGYLSLSSIAEKDSALSLRNFFGVVKIAFNDDQPKTKRMQHGNIIHGIQFTREDLRRQATAYYCQDSLAGKVLEQASARRQIGIVGLGAGTMSSYLSPEDTVSYFEINPHVIKLAQEQFSFISDSKAKTDFILGDARQTLEKTADGTFDILIIDAFSGDAIPVHLLTKEAISLYFKKLKQDGILIMHISNLYLDFVPLINSTAKSMGYPAFFSESKSNNSKQCFAAQYAAIGRTRDVLNKYFDTAAVSRVNISSTDSLAVTPWTDDYSNLFQILK